MKKVSLILSAVVMTAMMLSSCGGSSNPNNETNARVMVWQFVRSELKDPRSADFGLCELENTSTGTWKTDCYVDAKNGFGGTERLNFSCEVKHKTGDSWALVKLTFD